MKQILYDISDYKNNSDWLPIIASVFVLEMYVIFRAMRYKSVGELMHKWYADFGILSAIADITILLLGYVLVRYIYRIFIYPRFGFNPILFIITFLTSLSSLKNSKKYFLNEFNVS